MKRFRWTRRKSPIPKPVLVLSRIAYLCFGLVFIMTAGAVFNDGAFDFLHSQIQIDDVTPLLILLVVLAVASSAFRLGLAYQRTADGAEYCRHCGYNLTGTTTDTCSECGGRIPFEFAEGSGFHASRRAMQVVRLGLVVYLVAMLLWVPSMFLFALGKVAVVGPIASYVAILGDCIFAWGFLRTYAIHRSARIVASGTMHASWLCIVLWWIAVHKIYDESGATHSLSFVASTVNVVYGITLFAWLLGGPILIVILGATERARWTRNLSWAYLLCGLGSAVSAYVSAALSPTSSALAVIVSVFTVAGSLALVLGFGIHVMALGVVTQVMRMRQAYVATGIWPR